MKRTLFAIVTVWFSMHTIVLYTLAQDTTKWHLPKGAKARIGKGGISEIAYSPDGKRIAVASGIGIWLYDSQTGEALDLLVGHTYRVRSIAFSPDGRAIVSASWDKTILLWDAQKGSLLRTLTKHTSGFSSVAFSPDGKMITSASSDNTVGLWDTQTGDHIQTFIGHTDSVESVAFSPNGTYSCEWKCRQYRAFVGCENRNIYSNTHWTYRACL